MNAATRVAVAVRDCLADLEPGRLALVACSGGPDSLALAALAAQVAGPRGLRVGAVVVDHGWTASASRAGHRAAAVLKELGLDPVLEVRVDAGGPGGPEAAARDARYAALERAARAERADAVLLGHTLDDQAETVLLGLGRGSGARSLAGMPAARGRYRRPLLGLRRADTVAACQQLGLRPWQDPANADRRHARVRLRQLSADLEAALGPGATRALARTGDLLRDDADALDLLADRLLTESTVDEGLDPDRLLAAPAALRRRALLAAARRAGCRPGALGHRHAAALEALLSAAAGAAVDLPGGITARRRRDALSIG